MAFLALRSTYILNRNTCTLARFKLFVIFLVNAVVVVAGELYLCLAVAVDAPAHRQRSELEYLVHFLYLAVAALALYLAYLHVL